MTRDQIKEIIRAITVSTEAKKLRFQEPNIIPANVRFISQTSAVDTNTPTSRMMFDDTTNSIIGYRIHPAKMKGDGDWVITVMPIDQIDSAEIILEEATEALTILEDINTLRPSSDPIEIANRNSLREFILHGMVTKGINNQQYSGDELKMEIESLY